MKTAIAATSLAASTRAFPAAAYPNKPIHIVVGFAPGGGNDLLARIVGQKLAVSLGQSVVVENRPGAAGTIGANYVARAEPDGHTLLLGSVSNLVIGASTMAQVPFNVEKDFEPIILTAMTPLVLVVQSSLPANSIQELIAAAKAQPRKFTYATGGAGVANDLAGALFNQMAGVEIRDVPYSGDSAGIVALLAGQVTMMYSTLPTAVPHIESGKLKALGVALAKRATSMPDVPTIAESGLPGYEINLWNGVLTTGGVDQAIVQRLHDEIEKILEMPDVRERVAKLGFERITPSREAFANLIKADLQKYPPLVNKLGRRGK
ncbi:MAG TPA: tripartite tricarboxylate transporter substrate binding protein [Burkholderiaceae bacterium]|nr:tripartite tricarboxylate transporter substrate binding protein [Burkholderiaceae bacterium]